MRAHAARVGSHRDRDGCLCCVRIDMSVEACRMDAILVLDEPNNVTSMALCATLLWILVRSMR